MGAGKGERERCVHMHMHVIWRGGRVHNEGDIPFMMIIVDIESFRFEFNDRYSGVLNGVIRKI